MKNIRILKILALSLSIVFMLPLFACDDGNNNESNNPPPETPKQTVFYDELVRIPKLYACERFDNVEEAKAYAKTWREDYELYIPVLEKADKLSIEFITYRSADEKEKFSHLIKFKYTSEYPFYWLMGTTTLFKKGELDKSEFYIETKEWDFLSPLETFENYYNENGKIVSNTNTFESKSYSYGIKYDNFVLQTGTLHIDKTKTKTPQEIKQMVLDNIVPLSEQKNKDKEIYTKFFYEINGGKTGGYFDTVHQHENFFEMKRNILMLGKMYDFSCFAIPRLDEKASFNTTLNINLSYGITFYLNSPFSGWFIHDFELVNNSENIVYINIVSGNIPNSILMADKSQTYEYSISFDKESKQLIDYIGGKQNTRIGYEFTIKNGNGIIMTGNVRADDINYINLQEIKQKILCNIELIKGE